MTKVPDIPGVTRNGPNPEDVSIDWARLEVYRDEIVGELAALKHKVAMVEDVIEALVKLMRSDGASWEEIGKHLGVSKQAVWERYARGAEKKEKP